jgi:hypothetical protein
MREKCMYEKLGILLPRISGSSAIQHRCDQVNISRPDSVREPARIGLSLEKRASSCLEFEVSGVLEFWG